MAPKGRAYLCLCTVKGCNSIVDPETGQHGALLNLRNFKEHEQAEKHANLRNQLGVPERQELLQRVTQARTRVLEDQEELLANHLANLSLGPQHSQLAPDVYHDRPPVSGDSRYRNSVKRAKIEQLSKVLDNLDVLCSQLEGFKPPDDASVTKPEHSIQEILDGCKRLHIRAVQLETELNLSKRGEARRDSSVTTLRDQGRERLDDFREQVRNIEATWEAMLRTRKEMRQADLTSGIPEFETSHHFMPILDGASAIIQLVTLMVVACHIILGLPRRGCTWIYSMCNYLIETTVIRAAITISPYFAGILSAFPRDVRTARDQFQLEANAIVFAVCPKCHFTHKPSYDPKFPDIPLYPSRCRSRKYGKRCKEPIVRPKLKNSTRILVPIKAFVSFNFKDWLAGMLSRTNYEEAMDSAWDRMEPPPDGIDDKLLADIFQGSIIREFKGFDETTHFSKIGREGSGRYLFSLAFDFFNPLRNLAGGKKVSVGVVAIICLNLPIHLRYKPENIFLAGIIPGPQEPSLDAINHYLKPIVDEFLELWTGVRFSQTCLHPLGRLIFCAIIAVICDLPAARKAGGFASYHHEYYCSVCWCNRTEKSYDNFDYGSWQMRSKEECRDWARKYREAPTAKEADSFFDRSGVRSSELLRLPYYDPTKFLVIDPMHNLFLGLIKEHFQNILGYNPRKKSDGDNPPIGLRIDIPTDSRNPLPSSKHGKAGVRKVLDWLEEPIAFDSTDHQAIADSISTWSQERITLAALLYVARGVGCIDMEDDTAIGAQQGNSQSRALPRARPGQKKPTKRDVAEILVNWRLRQVESSLPPAAPQHGSVFTEAEMKAIRRDIDEMVKPSWVSSVPTTVSSSGPKLKSDQWRVFGSLYLPVTLIRLWSDCGDDEAGRQRQKLLHLTMVLMSAIVIASSRVTSQKHAEEYLEHMLVYRQLLQEIFPTYKCHPNHHVAMHVGELLMMYGPMHGWWTFPLERMIGVLQRIPTNYKPGEYEETISRSWYRSSNFRALFSKATCPPPIQLCASMFETLVRTDKRNTLAADSNVLDSNPNPVTDASADQDPGDDHYEVLREESLDNDISMALGSHYQEAPKSAKSTKRITLADGTSYATRETHEGNSCIMIKGLPEPYSIEKILQIHRSKADIDIWLVARPHKPFQTEDPYSKYPHLKARLWRKELGDTVTVVHIASVETHFAKCHIPWKGQRAMVAVSLSRVHSV